MSFSLRPFTPPDFTQEKFQNAPNAVLVPCPKDGVAPEHYHAMSIFPEYFKVEGQWIMAKESRMDCVPVYENGVIYVREFRILKAGDLVFTGRTENCEDGIYVYPDGFQESAAQQDVFAFRQNRSRETAFSKDYDEIYDLLRHDRDHGKIVWVMGPAFAFDYDARNAFEKLVNNGYVHAMLAGNALATHDLEGAYLHTALGQNIYTTQNQPNGHYNHLDLLNRVRYHSLKKRKSTMASSTAWRRTTSPMFWAAPSGTTVPCPLCLPTYIRLRTPCATRCGMQLPSSAWLPCFIPLPLVI